MRNWFSENPNPTGGLRDLNWDAHVFGRSAFASNFARRGASNTLFAPTSGEAFRSAFRRTHKFGSSQHIRNLEFMVAQQPENSNFSEALSKAKSGAGKGGRGIVGGVFGAGLGAAFIAMPAFTTPGGISEKTRAVVGGTASLAGWAVGSKVGMGIGAAAGFALLPGIGTAVGGALGWAAGGLLGAIGVDEGVQSLMKIPDNMVERERKRHHLDWAGNMDAFNTQSAATMRQMSLQAMNRGMATARSALGREAVMFHR
jgi:hypothetical protein